MVLSNSGSVLAVFSSIETISSSTEKHIPCRFEKIHNWRNYRNEEKRIKTINILLNTIICLLKRDKATRSLIYTTRQWYLHHDSCMYIKFHIYNQDLHIFIKIHIYTSRFVLIHQDLHKYIKIHICTSGFIYIHQDSYLYIKICINTSRFA